MIRLNEERIKKLAQLEDLCNVVKAALIRGDPAKERLKREYTDQFLNIERHTSGKRPFEKILLCLFSQG
jgi:hypothetical protein